jgi:hypothetical protein
MSSAPIRPSLPYTVAYVQQLLQVDEQIVVSYIHALGLQPRQDDITGQLILSQSDVEALRHAIGVEQTGLGFAPALPAAATMSATPDDALLTRQVNAPAATALSTSSALSGDQLTTVVDAVNQVKTGILSDLSQLLDDKLSGLDEVVVELIRAKSDNDVLRIQMQQIAEENEHLKFEVGRFKPVQFGFYRKS